MAFIHTLIVWLNSAACRAPLKELIGLDGTFPILCATTGNVDCGLIFAFQVTHIHMHLFYARAIGFKVHLLTFDSSYYEFASSNAHNIAQRDMLRSMLFTIATMLRNDAERREPCSF
jgi:hypothetical protein